MPKEDKVKAKVPKTVLDKVSNLRIVIANINWKLEIFCRLSYIEKLIVMHHVAFFCNNQTKNPGWM